MRRPPAADVPEEGARPRVPREESEVTSWPRGLVSYVPSGRADEGPPAEEEDRVAQRMRLAQRLIDLLRSLGVEEPTWGTELDAAERAYRVGDRKTAARLTDELLGRLGAAADRARSDEPGPG